jgi:hypothetical protein
MRTLLAAIVLAASVTGASATTVDFTLPGAYGAFSYPSADTGIVHYDDLTGFHITEYTGVTFGLPFVLGATGYKVFNWNTATDLFIPQTATGAFGPINGELIGAIAPDTSTGFIAFSGATFMATVEPAVPEPDSLPILASGLVLLAWLAWRNKAAIQS